MAERRRTGRALLRACGFGNFRRRLTERLGDNYSVDRRDELGVRRTKTVNQVHRLLLELVPGGAAKFLSAAHVRTLLSSVRPRDIVGRTRRQLTSDLITELVGIDNQIKTAKAQLEQLVAATGSGLLELNGIGPSGAARLIGDVGDIARFPSRAHFASWNGTAPLDASSGDQTRHRLSRSGNRAHPHRGCSRGLSPPVSSSDLVM